MVFPNTPLPLKGELLINGVWTDVTSYIRADDGITINAGRDSFQGDLTASTCNLTLSNRDGRFSNRNPLSPYYGLLPRNTQMRVSRGPTTTYLSNVPTTDGSVASTTDKAALDIVGDIDVRADVYQERWDSSLGYTVAGKYLSAGNQRSWVFIVNSSGGLNFLWSPDGTLASRIGVSSTSALPKGIKRLAIRANLDVNNGSGGYTVTFYYSTTGIAGSWTQLGSQVITTSGVTSIFNSTAALEIGGNAVAANFTGSNYDGKIFSVELRNSANTLVANPVFTSQPIGTTSFADGLGNTFTYAGGAAVTDDSVLFTGEVSEFPQRWDKTGKDVKSPIVVSGIIRRLTSGAAALNSPIYRNLSQFSALGYWSFEDGSQSTVAGNSVNGGQPARLTDISFGPDDTFPASASVASNNSNVSRAVGIAKAGTNTGVGFMMLYFKYDTIPANATIMDFYTSGSVARWNLSVTSTNYVITAYDADGAVVAGSTSSVAQGTAAPADQWIAMRILTTQSGGNITVEWAWYPLGGAATYGTTYTIVGTVGRPTQFKTGTGTNNTGLNFAHVLLSTANVSFSSSNFIKSSNAYVNETAAARINRICTEEGVPIRIIGDSTDSEPMGPQPTSTLLEIVNDCVATDSGRLRESRTVVGLEYRTRSNLIQANYFDIDYSAKHLAEVPNPTEDDQYLANDVTVTRPLGISARAVQETGPLSIQVSPNGVGRYQTSLYLNPATDDRVSDLAEWAVFQGTQDEARYPQTTIGLHRSPFVASQVLTDTVSNANIGDYYRIINLPSFLPPGPVNQLIEGYNITMSNFLWTVTWNSSPYGPFNGNTLVLGQELRADADDSYVNTALNTTATSLSVKTLSGPLWVTTALNSTEFPFDIIIAGERMTVTAISGTSSPQTLTVTRSVNGIVKSHSTNEVVVLAEPFYLSL